MGFVAISSLSASCFSSARRSGLLTAALPEVRIHRCACLRAAALFFVMFVCALGLASEARAQFAQPTVTNVNPNSGLQAGGTSVTITGTSFFGVTGANGVMFGGNPAASYVVNTPTQITATSPAGTGSVDITVTGFGGTSAANPPADQFTYIPPPTVTGVNPNTGRPEAAPASPSAATTLPARPQSSSAAMRRVRSTSSAPPKLPRRRPPGPAPSTSPSRRQAAPVRPAAAISSVTRRRAARLRCRRRKIRRAPGNRCGSPRR